MPAKRGPVPRNERGDVLSQRDEGYFIEGQSFRGRVLDISFRPRDRMRQVNLRMGPAVRYGAEHRMQIQVWRNRGGSYTLGDKSGGDTNESPTENSRASRPRAAEDALKSDSLAPAPPAIMPGKKSFYYSLCPSLQCAYGEMNAD